MNFNKTTEYALRILSFMAQDESRLYRVDDIYKELKIPYRYLRRLMTNLTRSNLIISEQGKYGGYRFAKPIASISLMDIVSAAGEDRLADECFFGIGGCIQVNKCVMHDKWTLIREKMREVLNTTNLADLKNNGPINMSPEINIINN